MKSPTPRARRAVFVPFGLATLALPLAAQSARQFASIGPGPAANLGNYATGILPVGDANGDGIDEFALATPLHGATSEGMVEMIDGATRTVIWTITGSAQQQLGTAMVAAPHLLAPSGHALWMSTQSGASSAPSMTAVDLVWGTPVLAAVYLLDDVQAIIPLEDDLDHAGADGVNDFAVLHSNSSSISILSSHLLALCVFSALPVETRLPQEVTGCAAGNYFGGDKRTCLALGAPSLNSVRVLDLATGQQQSRKGTDLHPSILNMGTSLVWDRSQGRILFGAPGSFGTRGMVGELRGPGTLTQLLAGNAGYDLGRSLATGDLDGDGLPELLVGGDRKMVLFPGQGAPLVFDGPPTNSTFGATLAVLGDADGDAFDDFAVSDPTRRLVHLYHGGPETALTTIGPGCSSGTWPVPTLQLPDGLTVGLPARFQVLTNTTHNLPLPTAFLLMGGPDPLGTPVPGSSCVSWLAQPTLLAVFTVNRGGTGRYDDPNPIAFAALGLSLGFQALVTDGTELVVTDAVLARVGW